MVDKNLSFLGLGLFCISTSNNCGKIISVGPT